MWCLVYAFFTRFASNCSSFAIFLDYMQDHRAKFIMGLVSLYTLIRLFKLNTLREIAQIFFPSMVRNFGTANLPFACVSSSLNKPMPFKLDVFLLSLQNVRRSFARILYLFNVQVDKNIAT